MVPAEPPDPPVGLDDPVPPVPLLAGISAVQATLAKIGRLSNAELK
jgi:hypothetical protein